MNMPPSGGKYRIIYADPPWRFEFSPSKSRSIESHYPTLSLDELKTMKVPADDTAVLFLWTPASKVVEALEVMEAWGFKYRSMMIWVKPAIGLGWYVRTKHELLLIGKRGKISPPSPGNRPPSVITAPKQHVHSQKPEVFYSIIEKMYPDASKIELFARKRRKGWDAWGNELNL